MHLDVRPKKTYGILELGGASTQIAFAPSGNILADKFPVLISGEQLLRIIVKVLFQKYAIAFRCELLPVRA